MKNNMKKGLKGSRKERRSNEEENTPMHKQNKCKGVITDEIPNTQELKRTKEFIQTGQNTRGGENTRAEKRVEIVSGPYLLVLMNSVVEDRCCRPTR